MSKSKRATSSQERWSQFLSFIAVWIPAMVVGTALVFWATGGFEPRSQASEPEPVDIPAPASTAPAVTPPSLETASPEPSAPAPRAVDRSEVTPRSTQRSSRRTAPPRRPRMSERERTARVAAHIRTAGDASETGDYQGAIAAYESALELDPNNFEVKILMSQMQSLDELEARSADRRYEESETELSASGTAATASAVELIIELQPTAPNPGDPYVLRVRADNTSNNALALQSVELVETHASMKHERGRLVQPLAKRLGPKETALLWERSSDWTSADRSGTIVVAVTLASGSRLSKTLRW